MSDTQVKLVKSMLDDYPASATPGWTVTDEGHHFIINGKFGQLEVGMVPGKSWDQWLFHENAGGGSLVIGYTRQNGQLKVMMLKANRFNLVGNGDDYELPGGFNDNGETKLAGAIREMIEPDEAGMLANPTPVSGRGYVGNRAFFQLNGEDEGTSVFAFELTPEQVTETESSDKLELMSWQDAIRITRDALSGHAIARFIADMLG